MYNTVQEIRESRQHGNDRWYFYEDVYRSTGGTEFRVTKARKVEMPRINDYITHSVFFLYPSRSAAEKNKKSGGTGFRVCVASERHLGFSHFYAVANAHVVHAAKDPAPVIRHSMAARYHPARHFMTGERDFIELQPEQWIAHKDRTVDLAITPLGFFPTNSILLGGIPSFTLLTHEVVRVFDIGLGDDVYMIGRFIHHDGKYFNQPSVRSGIISMMPDLIELEESGPPEEGFLIEMRSLGGFSGSP